MIYDEPLASPLEGEASTSWAYRIWACVRYLQSIYGKDLIFVGPPAEQWKLAQTILGFKGEA
jgi:hypothetical protein